jgi:hypothetical protein
MTRERDHTCTMRALYLGESAIAIKAALIDAIADVHAVVSCAIPDMWQWLSKL